MTRTLLLRLAGPMQSWGTQSRFRDRDTGREPSKSGVVGLVCAALGWPRGADISVLAALRMGVRIDRPGMVQVDYQTAGGVHLTGETYGVALADNPGTRPAISSRAYLADASFLAGLEGATSEQEDLLARVNEALRAPVWPLFLGRKSYVPGCPVWLPDAPPLGPGMRDTPLEETLQNYPWEFVAGSEREVRLAIETSPNDPDAEMRADWPLSFESMARRFATRYVRTTILKRPYASDAAEEGE